MIKSLKIGLLSLTIALAGTNSWSDEPDNGLSISKSIKQLFERVDLTGSRAEIKWRDQKDLNNNTLFNQAQDIVDFKAVVRIDSQGKLKLVGALATGSTFQSLEDNVGIGNDSTGKVNMNLRRFYLDYQLTSKINVQGGSIDPNASEQGINSLSKNGWVDGGRAALSVSSSHVDNIAVTVGRLGDFDKLNALSRAEDSFSQAPNYYQIHIRGRVNDVMKYTAEGTKVDDSRYLRGVLEIAVAKICKDAARLVDTIKVEEMLKEGSSAHQGFATSLIKDAGKWTFTEQYSYKKASFASTDIIGSHSDDFYRNPGHQVSGMVERKMKVGSAFVRAGKVLSSDTDTLSRSGYRGEIGYKLPLGK